METKEIVSMVVQVLIGLGVIIGAVVFIVRWCFDITKRVSKIEDKIDNLPLEIERRILRQFLPFASSIIDLQSNPLSAEDLAKIKRLMKKLQNETITLSESQTLKNLLEIEQEEAELKNNSNLLLAIGIALAAIALAVAIFDKKK
jgi:hypothetical protein